MTQTKKKKTSKKLRKTNLTLKKKDKLSKMILEMLGIGWILTSIHEAGAVFSKDDIDMPTIQASNVSFLRV